VARPFGLACPPSGPVALRGRTEKRSFVVNITSSTAVPEQTWKHSGPLDREYSFLPSLHRPRLHSRREPKAVRVSAVSTDQLVPCPTCGGFMRLSKTQVFECKQCGLAIRIEGVLKRMDSGE